jgi:ADP-heptose:LPS heptosyltransferase
VNPLVFRPDRLIDLKGEVGGEPRARTLGRRAGVSLDGLEPRVYLSPEERTAPAVPGLDAVPRPRVALHAGATQPCKGWGRERWAAVARALEREGVGVIEVGIDRAPLGVGLDLLGRTDLRELARLLAQVDLVLGDDSGPLHLALAVGTPALGAFGSTDPTLLYPRTGALHAVVSEASCRFCWPRRTLAYPSGSCPLARHECMEAVPVEAVLEAARRAMRRRPSVVA